MRSVNSKEEGTKRLVDRKQTGVAQVRNLTHEEENNMKTSKKFRSLMVSAAVLGMMGSSLVSTATAVMAAGSSTDTMKVTIHKKDALGLNGEIKNDGKESTNSDVTDLKDLKEVGFTIYDVSEKFYQMYLGEEDENGEKPSENFVGNGQAILDDMTNNIDNYVTGKTGISGETNDDGIWTTNVKEKDAHGRPAVYAVKETGAKYGMPAAQPIVFMTNMKDSKNQPLDEIYLYPKNYGIDKVLLDKDGETPVPETGDAIDYEIGDIAKYRVKYAIPYDIGTTKYNFIEMTDALKGGEYVNKSLKMFDSEGNEIKDLLGGTLNETPSGDTLFTLRYNLEGETGATLAKKLSAYKGQTLTVEYEVKVTSDLIADQTALNKVTLNTNAPGFKGEQSDVSQPITTGGIHQLKVDPENETLPGAHFAVFKIDEDGNRLYAKFNKSELPKPSEITWTEEWDKTSYLKSGDKGEIMLSGLEYGDYVLEEMKAPEGYVLPTAAEDRETPFKVEKGSYTLTEGMNYIENVPEADGSLPLTGGIGVITLIVVGGTMMAITTLRKKKED
jgi:fimbrial isopeptide formation D2 family protein